MSKTPIEESPPEAAGSGPCSVVPVQFAATTGNVHIDRAIEFAAELAMGKVKRMLVAEMTTAMKTALEANDRYPAPAPGTILKRHSHLDVICKCGRCVTFPLHPQNAEGDARRDNASSSDGE